MKIKICGITRVNETEYLNEAGVDYAGFVFYEKSKRNVTVQKAKELINLLNPEIKKVAVMVSPTADMIENIKEVGFDYYQIHKSLTTEVLDTVDKPVWYAVNIDNEEELNKKEQFINELPDTLVKKIDAIVVDAPVFGSGQTFNWRKSKRLKKAGSQSPPASMLDRFTFVLAGGLNANNVAEGIEIFNPDVVDISSGVEGADGKDKGLIDEFVKAVRNTEV